MPVVVEAPSLSGRRSEWIDHLRLAAAFAVVWIHVAGPILRDAEVAHDLQWWIAIIGNAAMRWCVPAFVMLSGMLLIPRAGEGNEWIFYRRRASRVLLPTLFWTGLYLVYRILQTGQFSPGRMLTLLIFGKAYYHLWFLYMLLGLYLATPFLSAFVLRVQRRTEVLAVVIGFGLASCQSMADVTREVWSPVFLSWIGFVPYFLLGHLLADKGFLRVPKPALIVAAGVSIVLTGLLAGLLWPVLSLRGLALMSSNFNPLIIVMSVSIFLLFRDGYGGFPSRGRHGVASAAPLMLGVYLVHPLCMDLLQHFGVTGSAVAITAGIPLCTVLVFFLSLVVCLGLARLPGGRRLVM